MRVPCRLAASLALVVAIPLSGPADIQAQQTYVLRCNLRTERMWVWSFGFGLNFKGATAGFGTRAPMDGECAWRDRGWYQDEPQFLMWGDDHDSDAVFGTMLIDHNNVVVDRIWSDGGHPAAALFDMMMGEWDKRGIIEFRVFNDGKKMVVKRARTLNERGNSNPWVGPFD